MTDDSAGPTPSDGPAEPAGSTEPRQPIAAERADRERRADRATRGVLAAVLGLEAVVVLLLPRALAFSDGGLGVTKTLLLVLLALLLVLAAGLMRRPWGVGLGSALQVLFVLTGMWLLAMLLVGAIFVAVWFRLLVLRRDAAGTGGGWRMLYL